MITLISDLLPTTDIHTLIDSGSTHCFLNSATILKHQLRTCKINLIPLWLFDGTTNSIIHSAVNLPLHFSSGNKQAVTFYVTLLEASCIAVLGHNWLTHYDLLIDWVLGNINFCSPSQTDSLTSPETAAMTPLSSDPPTPTPLIAPKVSFINAAAFTHLSKMDDNQVYQLFLSDKTTPNDTAVNMTGVPPDYHEFTNVFSKSCTSTPTPHQPYDLKIELEEGTSPPFGPIYSLSQSELKSLQEFLDGHLAMDFVHLSRLLGRALVLFVCKKDGSLHLHIDFRGLNKIMKKDSYPYPASPTSLTARKRQDSIQKLTSIMHTTWSVSKRVMNGKQLSAPTMAPSNGVMPFGLTDQCMHAGIPRQHPHLFWLWRRAYMACPQGTPPPPIAQPIRLHQ